MVPYSGNANQAIADVYAGRIQIMTEGYAGLLPAFQSGNLVPLALGAAQRLPVLWTCQPLPKRFPI
jgi:tripartite-type tricarboxylate transporter receptor subunit TctC